MNIRKLINQTRDVPIEATGKRFMAEGLPTEIRAFISKDRRDKEV